MYQYYVGILYEMIAACSISVAAGDVRGEKKALYSKSQTAGLD